MVFDSSDGKPPYQFLMGQGQVISGLERALLQLVEGDRVELSLDANWGYGEAGIDGIVPGNAHLNYSMELLEVVDE